MGNITGKSHRNHGKIWLVSGEDFPSFVNPLNGYPVAGKMVAAGVPKMVLNTLATSISSIVQLFQHVSTADLVFTEGVSAHEAYLIGGLEHFFFSIYWE